MRDSFDYKKAKQEAERMLEVIEKDPQSTWASSIQSLVPALYSMAVADHLISLQVNALKEANLDLKPGIQKTS